MPRAHEQVFEVDARGRAPGAVGGVVEGHACAFGGSSSGGGRRRRREDEQRARVAGVRAGGGEGEGGEEGGFGGVHGGGGVFVGGELVD